MKLINYYSADNAATQLGVRIEGGIVDVAAARKTTGSQDVPAHMVALLRAGANGLRALAAMVDSLPKTGAWLLDEAAVRPAACVDQPQKILCVGLNYRRHAAEAGMAVPTSPVLFSKFSNALAAHGETVPLPPTATEYDYEVELAVVIGKTTRNVAKEDALDAVLGYCTANDLSARDLQMRTSQWLLGKTLDKFAPIGPYLVTADEVPNPQDLSLRCWVNGELRQNSNTADMIFPVAEVIAYASQYMTLAAGDLILTGTPEGVIQGMAEKRWLRPGDEVTVEVAGLGRLTNRMASG